MTTTEQRALAFVRDVLKISAPLTFKCATDRDIEFSLPEGTNIKPIQAQVTRGLIVAGFSLQSWDRWMDHNGVQLALDFNSKRRIAIVEKSYGPVSLHLIDLNY